MDDFASDTDSDYTSYWRDWVGFCWFFSLFGGGMAAVWWVWVLVWAGRSAVKCWILVLL